MYAKLVLVAEGFDFDDQGRVSAKNLLLDTVHTSFPAVIESMDLLTLWTRGPDEPRKQIFQLALKIGNEELGAPEHIPIDFQEGYEAWQGISLDGFTIDQPGPIVFHFSQNGEERGVWILRAHGTMPSVGEAK
jgi:hypothetical protein